MNHIYTNIGRRYGNDTQQRFDPAPRAINCLCRRRPGNVPHFCEARSGIVISLNGTMKKYSYVHGSETGTGSKVQKLARWGHLR